MTDAAVQDAVELPATEPEPQAEQALVTSKGAVLPDAVVRRRIPEGQWRMLFNLFPGAKPDMALMVWDYCQARGLDPMKKPCHIVPMRVKVNGQWTDRDVVMAGIAEYRITAHRTNTYRGHSKPTYGPLITVAGVEAPEYCEMEFYRLMDGERIPFPVTVWFTECVGLNRDGKANERWTRAPRQMLTKCTEAAGLREGWPEEFGGESVAEELEGQGEARALTTAPAPLARRSERLGVTILSSDRPPQSGEFQDLTIENRRAIEAAADVAEILGPDEGAAAPSATSAPAARTLATRPAASPKPAAPAATRQKPAPIGAPPSTPQTTANALIEETSYVAPKGTDPFWEITAMVTRQGGGPPVGTLFITREEVLYKQACTCEGTGALLTLTWHHGKRMDGSPCKVLDAIAAAE